VEYVIKGLSGTVVYNKELKILIGLVQNALDGFRKKILPIIHGHQHCDFGAGHEEQFRLDSIID
jgi:hypothetical protein